MPAIDVRRHRVAMVVLCVFLAGLAGCAGSNPNADNAQSTTSSKYLINPLEPGQGYVQLGSSRYPFDGVICVTGPLEKDVPGRARIFGVYANFTVGGDLAAVSLTRYRSDVTGKLETIPTITDTAMVRMKTKEQVLGLKAQRARVIGQSVWHDVYDPSASTELIVRHGDRYEVNGKFGPIDVAATTAESKDSPTADTVGEIAARCPDKSTPTTQMTTTTPPSAPSVSASTTLGAATS